MRRAFVAAIVFALAMPAERPRIVSTSISRPHALSLARDRITLEVDLTPGVNIAPAIVALLDRDGDGTISPIEAEAYGQAVLADLVLELDGRPVALTLTRVETPSIGRDAGRRPVPSSSVPSDRSTRSSPAGVAWTSETTISRRRASIWSTRSFHRMMTWVWWLRSAIRGSRECAVEYDVHPRWPGRLLWLVLGAAGVATFFRWRPPAVASNSGGVRR